MSAVGSAFSEKNIQDESVESTVSFVSVIFH